MMTVAMATTTTTTVMVATAMLMVAMMMDDWRRTRGLGLLGGFGHGPAAWSETSQPLDWTRKRAGARMAKP